jgi:N-formylglutamate deformylase
MNAPDSEASFEIIRGHPRSPVVIHVPHSSTHIPAWVRERICLTDAELTDELTFMTDARTDEIADAAANMAAIRPWIFVNRRSRLVVDPERFPDPADEPMAAPEIGMGAVYTRTSHGGILRNDEPEHHEALLDRYFRPYANALTQLVEERLASVGDVTIIDLHSYPLVELPYERLHHAGAARPECCIGIDPTHTPATLRDAAIEAFAPLGQVAVNQPFAGTYVPLAFYTAQDARVSSVMVELRRDTYLAADNGIETVARMLTRLIAS